MATPTIPNGEEHFFPIIYEGNGAGQRVGKFVPFTDSGTIANSVIFNDADNAYLSRTNDAGDRDTFTISVWVKRGVLGAVQYIFDTYDGSSSNDGFIRFNSDNTISIRLGSPSNLLYITNRTFEDTSKFYHIMLSVNTNDSTAGDRAKLYIDGDRITSFSTQTNAGSGDNTQFNYSSATFRIGSTTSGSYDFDGYLAEFNFVDGQSLLPASFGLTDTSTGRWIPAQLKPHPTTTTTYLVTVVGGNPSNHPYYNVGSTNKFAINGSTATADVDLTLYEGATYRFDQSDSSNSGHPLRFSTVAHGTHASGGTEYTTNVTTVGTPGTSGSYTEITVASSAPDLHYYCSSHNGMGYQASTPIGHGANGFRLTFSDSSSLGADTSGNSNTFTATNLASTDQTTDSPTQNFPTIDSNRSSLTLSEGNTVGQGSPSIKFGFSGMTFDPSDTTGYYLEFKVLSYNGGVIGFRSDTDPLPISTTATYVGDGYLAMNYANDLYLDGTSIYSGSGTWTTNDIIGFYIKENKLYYSVNGTMQNSSNHVGVFSKSGRYRITMGHNSSSGSAKFQMFCPQSKWTYTPSGDFANYREINQDNAPETAKGVSGLSWIKERDASSNHQLYDSSRGAGKLIMSSSTNDESTRTDALYKFLKGGYAVGDNSSINGSGDSVVAWNWVANGGTTASNSNGSISSTVQANTTAGFSIVQYTGNGSSGTIGHGLSSVPEWIVIKELSNADSWNVWHTSLANTEKLLLNYADAKITGSTVWNSTSPTSSVITINGNNVNASSETYVAYVWHGVDGFSKFGSYTGNGSSDGTFVYTGFRPAWLMIKRTNSAANWYIIDTKRDPINPTGQHNINADTTTAESGNAGLASIDILANGFKNRQGQGTGINDSGSTYIYMAFAEHPFVGDGTSPVTAR